MIFLWIFGFNSIIRVHVLQPSKNYLKTMQENMQLEMKFTWYEDVQFPLYFHSICSIKKPLELFFLLVHVFMLLSFCIW